MLLLYTEKQTNRLGYTFKLIFGELLGLEYMVTTDRDYFSNYELPKISYCNDKINDELHIRIGNTILFESTIRYMEVDYFKDGDLDKIFRNYSDEIGGYDIFAAVFYMISRYEEYLPFITDEHQRFSYRSSFAFKHGFIERPVVNLWVKDLAKHIKEKYPQITFAIKKFNFINTIDIDQAYIYKGKSLYRTIGGLFRDILNKDYFAIKQRIMVLIGKKRDMWDCFDWLNSQIEKNRLQSIFFVLFEFYNKYDKNISVYNSKFRSLINKINVNAEIGLHPSYYCLENPQSMDTSRRMLSLCVHKPILSSRFHFLRFRLPDSYSYLMDRGITDDYSMGYSDCVGFRAGICSSYNFYDLDRDCETKMRIHPFEIMDVALKNGLQLNKEQAHNKIEKIIDEINAVDGEFISVWHNESLSDTNSWQGWREVYLNQLEYIKQVEKN
ncbi:MAG: polysaccharide deacetylase family protein [Bacteroidales bacterium]